MLSPANQIRVLDHVFCIRQLWTLQWSDPVGYTSYSPLRQQLLQLLESVPLPIVQLPVRDTHTEVWNKKHTPERVRTELIVGGTDPSSSSRGPSARQVVRASVTKALLGPGPISLCAMHGATAPVTRGDSSQSG